MSTRQAAFVLLLSSSAAAAALPVCTPTTGEGVTCSCDARVLHPLQGAVGLEEVNSKAQDIRDDPDGEWRQLLDDPIKVVHGPDGGLFITDHHHRADAWRLAGHPMVACQIADATPYTTEAAFWAGLSARGLMHLKDAQGRPISPAQLPANLEAMPDDPYRSLAWRLRKKDGFCRAAMGHVEFAEFVWADWLRPRLSIPAGGTSTKPFVATALSLTRGSSAAGLPGYVGDKPTDGACPGQRE